MQLRMWLYDLAREQIPTLDHLRRLCDITLESGYTALGLYLEHRFYYESAPWAAGKGALKPATVRTLIEEYPELDIVPFVNLLGHFEGFLYTEEGRRYAEGRFKGMQGCPSNPAFVELAGKLLSDVASSFTSEIIHLGADETEQLGACPICKARVEAIESIHPGADGKALLFGEHFAPLAEQVLRGGRRPAVWGDMFAQHPTALPLIPKSTLIFDWQYFGSPLETAKQFIVAGHEVVLCPTMMTYSATWMHLPQAELNISEHVHAAKILDAHGVCVTTWECDLFGNYETLIPAIAGAGDLLNSPIELTNAAADEHTYQDTQTAPVMLRAYLKSSEIGEEWARLMGIELQTVGGPFAYSTTRSSLKCRLLLYGNPFLLWLHHASELCGEIGDRALQVFDHAISVAPNASARGVCEFGRIAVEFVRHAEAAHIAYRDCQPGAAAAALAPARASFDDLAKIAKSSNLRIGGSLADLARCEAAKEHVEKVMRRIKQYGDGSLGYLPSFETITHPKFMPHDQGNWWLINTWANE